METEESFLEKPESIASDSLIPKNFVENIINQLDDDDGDGDGDDKMVSFKNDSEKQQESSLTISSSNWSQSEDKDSSQTEPPSPSGNSAVAVEEYLSQGKQSPSRNSAVVAEEYLSQGKPPSPSRNLAVVAEEYLSQESTQSTLPPPLCSQQSCSLFSSQPEPKFQKSKIQIQLKQQQKKLPEKRLMNQIKTIHNSINISLNKKQNINQKEKTALNNVKGILMNLKQNQAELCASLKESFKRQPLPVKSQLSLKKKVTLLQKKQQELLALFQEHNSICKRIKTFEKNKENPLNLNSLNKHQVDPQIHDLNYYHSDSASKHIKTFQKNKENPLDLNSLNKHQVDPEVDDFNDNHSDSASTVYSMQSLTKKQKLEHLESQKSTNAIQNSASVENICMLFESQETIGPSIDEFSANNNITRISHKINPSTLGYKEKISNQEKSDSTVCVGTDRNSITTDMPYICSESKKYNPAQEKVNHSTNSSRAINDGTIIGDSTSDSTVCVGADSICITTDTPYLSSQGKKYNPAHEKVNHSTNSSRTTNDGTIIGDSTSDSTVCVGADSVCITTDTPYLSSQGKKYNPDHEKVNLSPRANNNGTIIGDSTVCAGADTICITTDTPYLCSQGKKYNPAHEKVNLSPRANNNGTIIGDSTVCAAADTICITTDTPYLCSQGKKYYPAHEKVNRSTNSSRATNDGTMISAVCDGSQPSLLNLKQDTAINLVDEKNVGLESNRQQETSRMILSENSNTTENTINIDHNYFNSLNPTTSSPLPSTSHQFTAVSLGKLPDFTFRQSQNTNGEDGLKQWSFPDQKQRNLDQNIHQHQNGSKQLFSDPKQRIVDQNIHQDQNGSKQLISDPKKRIVDQNIHQDQNESKQLFSDPSPAQRNYKDPKPGIRYQNPDHGQNKFKQQLNSDSFPPWRNYEDRKHSKTQIGNINPDHFPDGSKLQLCTDPLRPQRNCKGPKHGKPRTGSQNPRQGQDELKQQMLSDPLPIQKNKDPKHSKPGIGSQNPHQGQNGFKQQLSNPTQKNYEGPNPGIGYKNPYQDQDGFKQQVFSDTLPCQRNCDPKPGIVYQNPPQGQDGFIHLFSDPLPSQKNYEGQNPRIGYQNPYLSQDGFKQQVFSDTLPSQRNYDPKPGIGYQNPPQGQDGFIQHLFSDPLTSQKNDEGPNPRIGYRSPYQSQDGFKQLFSDTLPSQKNDEGPNPGIGYQRLFQGQDGFKQQLFSDPFQFQKNSEDPKPKIEHKIPILNYSLKSFLIKKNRTIPVQHCKRQASSGVECEKDLTNISVKNASIDLSKKFLSSFPHTTLIDDRESTQLEDILPSSKGTDSIGNIHFPKFLLKDINKWP